MVHSTISNASSGMDEERIRVVEKILDYLITLFLPREKRFYFKTDLKLEWNGYIWMLTTQYSNH